MIKKSILVFLLFFVAYTVYVHYNPRLNASMHQWQDNYVKAERFLFDENISERNVVVGSSLTCRMNFSDDKQYYNLSFAGLGIFDGLKILKAKAQFPKAIFIETNYLQRGESVNFTSSVLSVATLPFRRNILSLRSEKQPLALLSQYIIQNPISKLEPYLKKIDRRLFGYKERQSKNKDEIFEKMLKIKTENYQKDPDPEELDRHIVLLSEYVDYFRDNNVKVIFFEMPVHRSLQSKRSATTIRTKLLTAFSDVHFIFPIRMEFHTTDGVHLSVEEAKVYKEYFCEIGEKLIIE